MKFPSLARIFLLAALFAAPAVSIAGPVVDIKGSEVIFQFSPQPTEAFTANLPLLTGKHASGVKIAGFGSAYKNRTLRMPVKGGAWDAATGAGQIMLGGGFVYTRNTADRKYKVVLSDIIFNLFSTPPVPPAVDPTLNGSFSALMVVDGVVTDRVVLWNIGGTGIPSLPLQISYKKLNFSGELIPDAAGATLLAAALGNPEGFDPTITLNRLTFRTAFTPQ